MKHWLASQFLSVVPPFGRRSKAFSRRAWNFMGADFAGAGDYGSFTGLTVTQFGQGE
jgi:hypothetical protein